MIKLRLYYSVFLTLRNKYGLAGIAQILWQDVLFDVRRGVNTFSPVGKDQLFDESLAATQNRYVPSTFSLVDSSIQHVEKIRGPVRGNFIDYGSGKGKVLIAAEKHSFKILKGIEYSGDLHRIALRNMKKLGIEKKVLLIEGDASEYQLCDEDTVLYFFNPFMGDILERCLKSISIASSNIERILIYANPVEDEIFCKYCKKLDTKEFQPGSVNVNFYTTKLDE